jgi:hypothetical protein
MEQITITRNQYEELVKDSILLSYLEAYGIDNWDFYSDAYKEYLQEIGEFSWNK